MSLDLGELRIALELDDDQFRRSLLEDKAAMAALAPTAQRELRRVKQTFDTEGRDAGGTLARGMQQGIARNSPLIVAAASGALIAGAPAALAAAGVLFGGIAAAAVHNDAQVTAAASGMADSWRDAITSTAGVTVPFFVSALQRLGAEAQTLKPQFAAAFQALQDPIQSLTTGLIGMAAAAMPGLVAAIQAAGPVFQGLASLMTSIGTGIGQFFQIVSEHGPAAGQAFKAVGDIVGELLPILGQLIGAGAELAADVLPPVAAALHAVASVLDHLGPMLPGILAGFLGFKAVGILAGPIDSLAGKLGKLGTVGQAASTGLSKLSTGLPLIGAALAVVGGAFERQSQQVQAWGRALVEGGNAAEQARTELAKYQVLTESLDTGMRGFLFHLTGYGTALDVTAGNTKAANQAAKDYYNSLSPLGKAQQDVDTATNNYLATVAKYGDASGQAAGDAAILRDKQAALADVQAQLAAATAGVSVAEQENATRLQGLANTASAANTQIGLLTGALDALTGKAVTMDQAEIAVTQSVDAVTQAIKGKTAALTFTNGQLDLSNSKSAAASQLLIQLASNMHGEIAAMEQQGATSDQVGKKADALRQQFIQQAEQLGATAGEAQTLANRYFGIPKDVHTEITADTAQATAAAAAFKAYWDSIQSRHVVITASYVSYGGLGRLGSTTAEAAGGIVQPMAAGGILPLARGGTAGIFQPHNPLIMVGDNQRVPEAYIPIDHSARSQAILAQAAAGMGYALAGGAPGGAGAPRTVIHDNRQVYAQVDARQLAREMAEQQRDLEFLSGVA